MFLICHVKNSLVRHIVVKKMFSSIAQLLRCFKNRRVLALFLLEQAEFSPCALLTCVWEDETQGCVI